MKGDYAFKGASYGAVGDGDEWPTFKVWECAGERHSVLSTGYALRSPWTHPWIVDLLEHLDLYKMVR